MKEIPEKDVYIFHNDLELFCAGLSSSYLGLLCVVLSYENAICPSTLWKMKI